MVLAGERSNSMTTNEIRELTQDETAAVEGGIFFLHLVYSAAVVVGLGSLVVREIVKQNQSPTAIVPVLDLPNPFPEVPR
jgi:hypothetical protein